MVDLRDDRPAGSDRSLHRLLDMPEINVVGFSFLLNMSWEFWQAPFFAGLATAQHAQAVAMCTRAALGDALISLLAFWIISATAKTRGWVTHPARWQKLTFIAVGFLMTIVLEILATKVLGRWHYAEAMPIVPGIQVGLLPLLQWLLLPPLLLWLVRRQLR